MMYFEIVRVDALADPYGGWGYNDVDRIGDFETRAADLKRAFLRALHLYGITLPRGRCVVVDDGYAIEVQLRKTGEPLLAALPGGFR